MYMAFSDLH